MKKYFAKKKGNGIATHLGWIVLSTVLATFFIFIGLFTYQYKNNTLTSPKLHTYFSQAETKLVEYKTYWQKKFSHQPKEKSTPIHVNKEDTAPQIHFEFYTALSNMKVTVPEPPVKPTKTNIVKNNPPPTVAVKKAEPEKTLAMSQAIVKAEELEQELSKQLIQHHYIVQLGVFSSLEAATRYQKTLSDSGIGAAVNKTANTKKETYRVQAGPYASKEEAIATSKQLEKKGISGVVRKMNLG